MFPKSLISRIILWLWKKYHCSKDLHVLDEDGYSCAACEIVIVEFGQLWEDDTPAWACPDWHNHNDWRECFACKQNHDYHEEFYK